jgi:hypothetical protein
MRNEYFFEQLFSTGRHIPGVRRTKEARNTGMGSKGAHTGTGISK